MSAANALNNIAKAAVGLGAGASLFQASMYNVDGGFRAVMFDRLRGVQVRRRLGVPRDPLPRARARARTLAQSPPRRSLAVR